MLKVLRFRLLANALCAFSGLGCGATGLDWVGEPETVGSSADARDVAMSEPLPPGASNRSVEAPPVVDDAPEHRRLARTVTLGGDAAPPPAGAAPAPGPGGERGTTVIINNYPSAPSYGYPYGVIASSRVSAGSAVNVTAASPGSSTIQPGQNWAPPPRSGPAFPFHVGPAPAWEPERVR